MYNKEERALIWLDTFEFVTYKKLECILKRFETFSSFFDSFDNEKDKVLEIFDEECYSKMKIVHKTSFVDNLIIALDKKGVTVITQFSSLYPRKMMDVDCPPFILYTKGDLSLLNSKAIAVVGTRQPTAYGRKATEVFTKHFVENDLTIVSGLAYGIDSLAHETTLKNNGKTIAVLGGGFDYIYPSSNTQLERIIEEKGLVITEYKPSVSPTKYTFPVRNRIIAGLSLAVFIPEAGEKSGTLRTKEYAVEMGRDVFVLPGNIFNSESAGTNRLIKSCQSVCVTSYEDVLFGLKMTPKDKTAKVNIQQLDMNEELIVNLLKDSDATFEEICQKTSIDSKILNSCLTSLQIRGIIKKSAGNRFSL